MWWWWWWWCRFYISIVCSIKEIKWEYLNIFITFSSEFCCEIQFKSHTDVHKFMSLFRKCILLLERTAQRALAKTGNSENTLVLLFSHSLARNIYFYYLILTQTRTHWTVKHGMHAVIARSHTHSHIALIYLLCLFYVSTQHVALPNHIMASHICYWIRAKNIYFSCVLCSPQHTEHTVYCAARAREVNSMQF